MKEVYDQAHPRADAPTVPGSPIPHPASNPNPPRQPFYPAKVG
jgi:hypothetical protein